MLVGSDGLQDGIADFRWGVGDFHPVDLAGVEEPVHVLLEPEHRGALIRLIAAHAFEETRTVVHHVGKHVELRVFPGYQFPIEPDVFGLRQGGHQGLLSAVRSAPTIWRKLGG